MRVYEEVARAVELDSRHGRRLWERMQISPLRSPWEAERVRYLLVVARDRPDLRDSLARRLSKNPRIQVLLDRRRGERRRRAERHGRERRRFERRRPAAVHLGSDCFVIVRRQIDALVAEA